MQGQTIISKDIRNGWTAKTNVELGENRVLEVSTRKGSGGALVTTAYVHTREGNFLTHRFNIGGPGGDGDYSERLEVSKPARVTENAVRDQHTRNVLNLDAIVPRALAHYNVEAALA